MNEVWRRATARGWRRPLKAILVAGLAVCGSQLCLAADNVPKDCASLAARVAKKTGATFEARSQSKPVRFLATLRGAEIQIRCSPGNRAPSPLVVVKSAAEYPARSFYDMLADIGTVVSGRPARQVRLRAHHCHRAARRSADRTAQKRLHGFHIVCHRSPAGSMFSFGRGTGVDRQRQPLS